MEQETQVPAASEQEVVETQETETTTTEPSQDVEALKAELTKAKEYGENQKIRAEKAEKKAKEAPETTETKFELSQTDVLAIARSDVHEEDIERVTKFAQMEGISVKDALGHDDMKAILERRAEARKVAAASNTDTAKTGSAGVTGEGLLKDAANGKLPDAKDLPAMWDAE